MTHACREVGRRNPRPAHARHGSILLALLSALEFASANAAQPDLGRRTVELLTVEGHQFKDLNRNDTLDPYEDWRLPASRRTADLIQRMTLEEVAGAMVHGTLRTPQSLIGASSGEYDLDAMVRILEASHASHFISRLSTTPAKLAEQNNALQELAERTRLGIPFTISTDPRNHFDSMLGASTAAKGFSQWPEPIGLAAIGDPALVRRFADIAREEYRAVGIHMALSPQADLSTEPRWPRISGTFGEDPRLTSSLVRAYVEGMQGGSGGVAPSGVIAVVKHWVGYGAAAEGWDSHNYYGRFADFTSHYADHVTAFEGAFAANVAGVMPTYSILRGVKLKGALEPVGAAFSKPLLTDLLRKQHRFAGFVLTDWAITEDCNQACTTGEPRQEGADIGMPWGVERLSANERFAKAIDAGVDQFGGTERSNLIVEAVKSGRITRTRLEDSVRRLLVHKFEQGLFENPYVDPAKAERVLGNPASVRAGLDAQRRALILLQNEGKLLPLRTGIKVYLYKVSPESARSRGLFPVNEPSEADVAIMRVAAPFELLHPGYFFGRRQHEGSLAFSDSNPDYERIKAVSASVPTIVSVFLDRPAILTNIRDQTRALIGDFGASDAALLEVLMGARPEGRLPFELPRSMQAVQKQAPDKPADSVAPLYPIRSGLSY
jgi:beta-glucosidase